MKIDIMNKQLTIDSINASMQSGQTSDQHFSEQTEFADRLGQMNCCYQGMSSDVVEKLKHLEMLKAKWSEYDDSLKKLSSWFIDQNDTFEKCCTISNEMSVQQALSDCKKIDHMLESKEFDIEKVKQTGLSLVQCSNGFINASDIDEDVAGLNREWAKLDHQVGLLGTSLEDALKQWQVFNVCLQQNDSRLVEVNTILGQNRKAVGDLHAVKTQLNQLKTVKVDLDNREDFYLLKKISDELKDMCAVSMAAYIENNVAEMEQRYDV